MAGRRQHFLPASFIGRFSLETAERPRDRHVWVQRTDKHEPFRDTAGAVGWISDLYGPGPSNLATPTTDEGWVYERRLPEALDALLDQGRQLDGNLWVEVLVPFVASLFVRTPDFDARFSLRIPGFTGPQGSLTYSFGRASPPFRDNTNAARGIEWQRLLAPVISADWTVMHGSGLPILPLNDVGYCLMSARPGSEAPFAYAVPIAPDAVLALNRRRRRRVLDLREGAWFASVRHLAVSDLELLKARSAIQRTARVEIYGPTEEAVRWPLAERPQVPTPVGPHGLVPFKSSRHLVPYAEDWFRLVGIVQGDLAGADGAIQEVRWEAVSRAWQSLVQIPVNLPRYAGGLRVQGRCIYIDLTRIPVEVLEADASRSSALMKEGLSGEASWVSAAAEGSPGAMFNLAIHMRERGARDAADDMSRRAAEAGHVGGMLLLANALLEKEERVEAESWYKRAAQKGDAFAMEMIAFLVAERGAPDEGKEWRHKAARAGNIYSMMHLAYEHGELGELAQSEYWWRFAAEDGEPIAMNHLGALLQRQNRLAEAEEWWTRAAEAGLRNAQNNLRKFFGKEARVE